MSRQLELEAVHEQLAAAAELVDATREPVRATVRGARTKATRERAAMPKRKPDDLVRAAVDDVLATDDPADRAVSATRVLVAMDEAKVKLAESRREAAQQLKATMTLAQLAELLGVSRSRAQQIVEGLSRSTAARSSSAAKRGRAAED